MKSYYFVSVSDAALTALQSSCISLKLQSIWVHVIRHETWESHKGFESECTLTTQHLDTTSLVALSRNKKSFYSGHELIQWMAAWILAALVLHRHLWYPQARSPQHHRASIDYRRRLSSNGATCPLNLFACLSIMQLQSSHYRLIRSFTPPIVPQPPFLPTSWKYRTYISFQIAEKRPSPTTLSCNLDLYRKRSYWATFACCYHHNIFNLQALWLSYVWSCISS